MQLVRRVGIAFMAGSLACSYVVYGLTHPPKGRASHYQGVNSIRNISIVLSNIDIDSHQDVSPVVPTRTK